LITDKGRGILAKYLIGQAPAYASFLALGVGRKPLGPDEIALNDQGEPDNLALKNELDFEVLRVPISSRGYVYDDDGTVNIVFVGELPSEQRYEFSEIGVFSAKANPVAGSFGSRMIYTFSESENWEYHDEDSAVGLPTYLEPLYGEQEENIIDKTDLAFRTGSNNALFAGSDVRLDRQERPRFLDRTLIVRGDLSTLEHSGGAMLPKEDDEFGYYSSHIHLTGSTPNLNRNPPNDELRIAFSVLNKLDTQANTIDNVKILVEFASTDAIDPDNYARMEIELLKQDYNFNQNRYFVSKKTLGGLRKSSGFTWSNVNVVKIYASVYETPENPEDDPILSDNFYISLDGLRFENLSSVTPLYGLSGYSVVRNEEKRTIVKEPNSSNLLEFRFGLGIE
jgi:hypothetical protein